MTAIARALKALFATAPAARPGARLGTEPLEAREVPSVTSAVMTYDTVYVRTPSGGTFRTLVQDAIDIRTDDRASNVTVTQVGRLIKVADSTNGFSRTFEKKEVDVVRFHGGAGNDTVIVYHPDLALQAWGKGGDDYLVGGGKADSLAGGDGNDWLEGRGGDDKLWGEAGMDRLFGGDGRDRLYGGDGRDALDGGYGDDYLNGGAGDDSIDGGPGTDTFRRNLYFAGLGLTPPKPEDTFVGPPSDYARPKETDRADEPQMVVGSFLTEVAGSDGPTDGAQAGSPTCAFLAALSSVAARTGSADDLVSRIGYDEARDVYQITLYPNGVRTVVEVNGDWTEGMDPSGALWVTLYQKAYLKVMGVTSRGAMGELLPEDQWTAASTAYQRPTAALQALTGKASDFVPANVAFGPFGLNVQLATGAFKGFVALSKDSVTDPKVVADHCYRIVSCQNVGGTWKVTLYNPWGHDAANPAGTAFTTADGKDDGYVTLTWAEFVRNFDGYARAA